MGGVNGIEILGVVVEVVNNKSNLGGAMNKFKIVAIFLLSFYFKNVICDGVFCVLNLTSEPISFGFKLGGGLKKVGPYSFDKVEMKKVRNGTKFDFVLEDKIKGGFIYKDDVIFLAVINDTKDKPIYKVSREKKKKIIGEFSKNISNILKLKKQVEEIKSRPIFEGEGYKLVFKENDIKSSLDTLIKILCHYAEKNSLPLFKLREAYGARYKIVNDLIEPSKKILGQGVRPDDFIRFVLKAEGFENFFELILSGHSYANRFMTEQEGPYESEKISRLKDGLSRRLEEELERLNRRLVI
jgi:hypothetical protein